MHNLGVSYAIDLENTLHMVLQQLVKKLKGWDEAGIDVLRIKL